MLVSPYQPVCLCGTMQSMTCLHYKAFLGVGAVVTVSPGLAARARAARPRSRRRRRVAPPRISRPLHRPEAPAGPGRPALRMRAAGMSAAALPLRRLATASMAGAPVLLRPGCQAAAPPSAADGLPSKACTWQTPAFGIRKHTLRPPHARRGAASHAAPAAASGEGPAAAAAAAGAAAAPADLGERLLAAKCKVVDFGNACWVHKQFTSDIQTRQYRCPEARPVLGRGGTQATMANLLGPGTLRRSGMWGE